MDNTNVDQPADEHPDAAAPPPPLPDQPTIEQLTANFKARLITAALRAEAVRAGMIDLDGLKLLDLSSVELTDDDAVANGDALMQELRASKPWLFRTVSSSSAAAAPPARPVRQKTAMEMTDEEYAAARQGLIKY